jgi:hypothetical protein
MYVKQMNKRKTDQKTSEKTRNIKFNEISVEYRRK